MEMIGWKVLYGLFRPLILISEFLKKKSDSKFTAINRWLWQGVKEMDAASITWQTPVAFKSPKEAFLVSDSSIVIFCCTIQMETFGKVKRIPLGSHWLETNIFTNLWNLTF